MKRVTAPILVALAVTPALAQTSSVSPAHKFSWSENCGWMNWRDAGSPPGTQGARRVSNVLAGYIWCENIGWISLGSGAPANGTSYVNATGADFGVNVDAGTGNLSGMAWGENIGWINFAGGSIAGGAGTAARIDAPGARLRGYAWGENIGWVNLDDAVNFVGLDCYANCDQSTVAPILNVQDFSCFLNKFASGDPYANCDNSTVPPVLNIQDFSCFLNKFAQGCAG